MRGLYIINGLGFTQYILIGGADKRAIEIVNRINKKTDNHIDIITTDTGERLFNSQDDIDLSIITIKRPFWWKDFLSDSLAGRIFSYLYATLYCLVNYQKMRDYDFYYTTSDFFFDLIPAAFYKVINKKPVLSIVHHYIKNPFSRNGNFLINILNYLSQRFGFLMIKFFSDALFLYDTEEGKILHKKFFKGIKKVFFIENGIDSKRIDEVAEPLKKYEACFVGGLRFSKGINEFVPIWKEVVKKEPSAKFLVIGKGSKNIEKKLKEQIKANKLEKHIILEGSVHGTKMYEKLLASKVYLFPSHEEGWGISVIEAMYCRLPIICYDLPAFSKFGKSLDKVKIGDTKAMAEKVLNYLQDEKKVKEIGTSLKQVSAQYTWDSIAKKEEKYIKEALASL